MEPFPLRRPSFSISAAGLTVISLLGAFMSEANDALAANLTAFINRLTALELHVGVNEHGWAIVEGEAGENALELLFGRISQRRSQAVTVTVPTHLKIGDTA